MNFWQITLELLKSFGLNSAIFGLTLLFAIPLGLIVAFGSMSKIKILSSITKTFVWIIRGTPLMLQIIIVYYGPGFFGYTLLPMLPALTIAFAINYACYFSEIYRGGIESISKGQYEAGQVLGMSKTEVFFKVILMQVIKRILAPMSNEIITLVKDTSLAQTIGALEIIMTAQNHVTLLWPLFYTAVFFLAFVGLLTLLFGYLEKKLSYYSV